MQTKNTKKGFTLVELVIVIAVIAILAAVLIPTFTNIIAKSNESAALQTISGQQSNYISEIAPDTIADYTVFTYNDYAVVFHNGALISTVGKFDDNVATIKINENNFTITRDATSKNVTTVKLGNGTDVEVTQTIVTSGGDFEKSGVKAFVPNTTPTTGA